MLLENLTSGSDRKSCKKNSVRHYTWLRFNSSRQRKKTHDVVVLDTVGLAPSTHNVGVVVSKDRDDVNTLGPQLREVLNVAGDVGGGADGGKGTFV